MGVFVKAIRFLASCSIVLFVAPLVAGARVNDRRPVDYVSPTVSADGTLLFFIADVPNPATAGALNPDNLHFARADGSDMRRLTHDGAQLPRWIGGADGEITFVGVNADTGNVFAMKPDGSARRLAAQIRGRSPVLSPDGTKVAYLVGPWRASEIWVANADSSAARRVAGGPRTTAWNPAWSPDGRKLAVQWSTESGLGSRIAVVDLPTRTMAVLDVAPPEGIDSVQDEAPAWFPNGKRIVFQSNRGGNVDVWVINADGTGLVQVTGAPPKR